MKLLENITLMSKIISLFAFMETFKQTISQKRFKKNYLGLEDQKLTKNDWKNYLHKNILLQYCSLFEVEPIFYLCINQSKVGMN